MSEKKSAKKNAKESKEKSERKSAKKPAAMPEKKPQPKKRSRKFNSNKLIFLVLIAVVVCALAACGVGYYLDSIKMEEISIEDETVENLTTKYFRGSSACIEYDLGLFSDDTINTKDLDYDTKEEIVIDYAVRKNYDKIGFSELKELYSSMFNDGSALEEKYYYDSTSGYYEKDGDVYILEVYSACSAARPPEMICLVPDKAYKSSQGIKVITGLYSGTADTQYLYSGLNWESDALGLYGEIDPTESELAKWEIYYKYDSKLGRYFLDSTKKL